MNADGSSGVVAHGYFPSGGEFTTIDFPGAQVNRGALAGSLSELGTKQTGRIVGGG